MNDSKESVQEDSVKAQDEDGKNEVLDTAPLETSPTEKAPFTTSNQELQKMISLKKSAKKTAVSQNAQLKHVMRCELGAERKRNEDSCFVFSADSGGTFPISPFGLFVVADGMGGHKNGHVASNIAARVSAKHILDRIFKPIVSSYESTPNLPPIQEVLEEAVRSAHMSILESQPGADSGTTVTMALILGRRLYVAHVGDSRLYYKTEDKFEVVTKDHSLVQRLKDVGQYTEAAQQKYGSVLIRAVGQGDDVEVDTYMRLLPKNGRILLCSDGLWGLVADEKIEQMMGADTPLDEAAETLYQQAMEAGGHDNITSIIVEFAL